MSETTSYGTWQNFNPSTLTVRSWITNALSGWTGSYDVEALEAAYRTEINKLLDLTGLSLAGQEFIGPAHLAYGSTVIAEALELASNSFWDLAARNTI